MELIGEQRNERGHRGIIIMCVCVCVCVCCRMVVTVCVGGQGVFYEGCAGGKGEGGWTRGACQQRTMRMQSQAPENTTEVESSW